MADDAIPPDDDVIVDVIEEEEETPDERRIRALRAQAIRQIEYAPHRVDVILPKGVFVKEENPVIALKLKQEKEEKARLKAEKIERIKFEELERRRLEAERKAAEAEAAGLVLPKVEVNLDDFVVKLDEPEEPEPESSTVKGIFAYGQVLMDGEGNTAHGDSELMLTLFLDHAKDLYSHESIVSINGVLYQVMRILRQFDLQVAICYLATLRVEDEEHIET